MANPTVLEVVGVIVGPGFGSGPEQHESKGRVNRTKS